MLLRWNSALSHTHRRRACTQRCDSSRERGLLPSTAPKRMRLPRSGATSADVNEHRWTVHVVLSDLMGDLRHCNLRCTHRHPECGERPASRRALNGQLASHQPAVVLTDRQP